MAVWVCAHGKRERKLRDFLNIPPVSTFISEYCIWVTIFVGDFRNSVIFKEQNQPLEQKCCNISGNAGGRASALVPCVLTNRRHSSPRLQMCFGYTPSNVDTIDGLTLFCYFNKPDVKNEDGLFPFEKVTCTRPRPQLTSHWSEPLFCSASTSSLPRAAWNRSWNSVKPNSQRLHPLSGHLDVWIFRWSV